MLGAVLGVGGLMLFADDEPAPPDQAVVDRTATDVAPTGPSSADVDRVGHLWGDVVSDDGPVIDARVTVGSDAGRVWTTSTDVEGRWEVEVPVEEAATFHVTLHALPRGITLRSEGPVEVTLQEGQRRAVLIPVESATAVDADTASE